MIQCSYSWYIHNTCVYGLMYSDESSVHLVRPGKLDSLFPIHQILCLYVGGQSFFIIHYTIICLQTFIKSF